MKNSLTLILLLLCGCNQPPKHAEKEKQEQEYTCPMHAQVVQKQPGACPICGMDLVLRAGNDAHSAHGALPDSLAAILKPTDERVLSAIETVQPQQGGRPDQSVQNGLINYSGATLATLSARVSGRIERLYVRYNFQSVSKGQKIMDIYSPELVNAQQELLFLKNNQEPALMESARARLRFLGVSQRQIETILKTGKTQQTLSIYSPYSGYVSTYAGTAAGSAAPATGSTRIMPEGAGSAGGMGTMESSPSASPDPLPAAPANAPFSLREGQYVRAGQQLFSLINSNKVWAEFYVSSASLASFKKGSMLQIQSASEADKKTSARLSLVQPYYKEGTNYALLKASIENKGNHWKIGELIKVQLSSNTQYGTWLPRTALVQAGRRYIVFLKKDGAFVPAYVQVKSLSDQWVNIGNSLSPAQEVAGNAWFLVDSESFIKVKQPSTL